MHVAASTSSCARKPKTFVDDERDFGDGKAIGVEAAAAVMGAALSSVDRFERAWMPVCRTHVCLMFCVTREVGVLRQRRERGRRGERRRRGARRNGGGANRRRGRQDRTLRRNPTTRSGKETRAHVRVFVQPRVSVPGVFAEGSAATPSADERRITEQLVRRPRWRRAVR